MRSWQIVAGLAALAVAAQCYGLYRPTGPPAPSWFPQFDKVEHAAGFALPVALILGALALRARLRGRTLDRRLPVAVALIFLAHAVLSEVIQHTFYRTRTVDPVDVLADSLGVALGVGTYGLLSRRIGLQVRR